MVMYTRLPSHFFAVFNASCFVSPFPMCAAVRSEGGGVCHESLWPLAVCVVNINSSTHHLFFILLFFVLPPGQLAPSVYVLVDIYAAAMCSEACKAEPCAALAKRWTPAGPPMQRDRRTPELRGRPTGAVRGCGARARSQGALTRRPVVRKVALAVLQIAEFMAYHRARAMTAKIRSRFFAVFKRLRQTHPTLLRQSCSHRLRTRTYKHVRSRFVIPELVLSRRAVLPSG